MYDRIWYGDFSFFWGGELGFASYPASWRPPLSVQRLLATAAPHPTQTKSIVATNSAASWRGVQSFTMVVVIYLQWCVLTMCMKNVYGIWEVRSIDVIFKILFVHYCTIRGEELAGSQKWGKEVHDARWAPWEAPASTNSWLESSHASFEIF